MFHVTLLALVLLMRCCKIRCIIDGRENQRQVASDACRVPPTLKSQVKSQAETVRREEEPAAHSEIATRLSRELHFFTFSWLK